MHLKFALTFIIGTLLWVSSSAPGWSIESIESLATIRQRVIDFLSAHHPDSEDNTDIKVGPLDSRLRLAKCGAELEAFLPSGARTLGNTSVGVRCPGPNPWTIYVSASIKAYDEVFVAAQFLARGSRLTRSNLRAERRDLTMLSGGFVTDAKNLIGKQLRRSLQPGAVISPRLIANPLLIQRGQQVNLSVRQDGIEVTAAGIALRSAALGDRVTVRSESSQRIVEGVAAAANLVRVEP